MADRKYRYNQNTLKYEAYKRSTLSKLGSFFLYTLLIVVGGFIFQYGLSASFPSAKERILQRELSQMSYKFSILDDKTEVMSTALEGIHDRDGEVHRMMFGMDPIDANIWNGGVGGHNTMDDIIEYESSADVIKNTQARIDKLQGQLAIQAKSLDTIYQMAADKEKMIASIPSIKPVQEDKLNYQMRMMSGFGWRIHPIHKVKKFHQGIDFSAPKGTAIQASGDGRVSKVKVSRAGYGKQVIVDHGFGYSSLYGHMSKIIVKQGEKIKRGQLLGYIGSSGASTAPHLHYEVRLMNKAINPIHYCMDGLTPEEYELLVQKSSVENQSFD